jgi:hypothetical protein
LQDRRRRKGLVESRGEFGRICKLEFEDKGDDLLRVGNEVQIRKDRDGPCPWHTAETEHLHDLSVLCGHERDAVHEQADLDDLDRFLTWHGVFHDDIELADIGGRIAQKPLTGEAS